jgi:AcrR family transcriptional regulator
VPLLNLIRPKEIMDDLWRGTEAALEPVQAPTTVQPAASPTCTARSARRRTTSSQDTRDRLVATATEVLAPQGFAAATARAIGEAAGCNQALVFYHFGSLNHLLLAALDASSQQRLLRYHEAVAEARNLRDLRRIVRRLYQEDRTTGHVTVLAELVAGGLMDRELGKAVAARVQPWIALAEEAVRTALPSPMRRRTPTPQIAYAVVAMFLGLEILGQLSRDHSRGGAVVERLTKVRAWQPQEAAQAP